MANNDSFLSSDILDSINPLGKAGANVATPALPAAPAPAVPAVPAAPLIPSIETPVADMVKPFGSNKFVSGTKEFLTSNSLVAKVAFLILVVLLFVLLLRLGTYLLTWLYTPSPNPKIVSGLHDGTTPLRVAQNPASRGAIPLLRSVNQEEGIEFTYSIWLNIKDLDVTDQKYKHIFHKGNYGFIKKGPSNGLSYPNNSPGLYIHPTRNDLVLLVNTFNDVVEEIVISDIPLNKWINLMVRVEGNVVDVYVNGTIVVRHELNGVPRQNYEPVYVCQNGGFNGRISDLWYHNYALNTSEILDIVRAGPSLSANPESNPIPPYFSLRWFYNNGN